MFKPSTKPEDKSVTQQEMRLREALAAVIKEFCPHPETLDPEISSHKVLLDAIKTLRDCA